VNKLNYIKELNKLKNMMDETPNTPFTIWAKVTTLVIMNIRYEKIAFNKTSDSHPYLLTDSIIRDAIIYFRSLIDISFIESDHKNIINFKSKQKEEKHKDLFNEIWDRFNDKDFSTYIERYVYRIKVNNLCELIKNKVCVDLDCGNGVFCFAMLGNGANFTAGIDYGEKSIEFAKKVAEMRGVSNRSFFRCATVYETGYQDNTFDFAVQNGVFHHLDLK